MVVRIVGLQSENVGAGLANVGMRPENHLPGLSIAVSSPAFAAVLDAAESEITLHTLQNAQYGTRSVFRIPHSPPVPGSSGFDREMPAA